MCISATNQCTIRIWSDKCKNNPKWGLVLAAPGPDGHLRWLRGPSPVIQNNVVCKKDCANVIVCFVWDSTHLVVARGARAKRVWGQINAKIPTRQKLGLVAIEQWIRKDGMHWLPMQSNITDQHTQASIESYVRKQPHPSAALSQLKSNKRMRKPDWLSQLCALCVRGYTLSLLLAFRLDYLPEKLIPKGPGTHRGTRPGRPIAALLW